MRSILDDYFASTNTAANGRIIALEAQNAVTERRLHKLEARVAELQEWMEEIAGDLIERTEGVA